MIIDKAKINIKMTRVKVITSMFKTMKMLSALVLIGKDIFQSKIWKIKRIEKTKEQSRHLTFTRYRLINFIIEIYVVSLLISAPSTFIVLYTLLFFVCINYSAAYIASCYSLIRLFCNRLLYLHFSLIEYSKKCMFFRGS